jgi:hypothetical protein
MNKTNTTGLREAIVNATSVDEVESLLKQGYDTFTVASERTKRSWKLSARKRLIQLQKPNSASEEGSEQKVTKKSQKKSVKK